MNYEYKVGIPHFYWEFADRNPKLFKQYVLGYLKLNHRDLKPVRVVKYKYVICVKKD